MQPASRTVLFDFDHATDLANWLTVNDGVMGGVSQSRFELERAGVAAFRGVVSLANNGGFASVRTRPGALGTSGASALVLRIRSDGRRYKLTARTGDEFDGVQYQAPFTAPSGQWAEITIALAEFRPTFRGRPVPGAPPLAGDAIRSVGFLISDRQEGPFELLVDWIAAGR